MRNEKEKAHACSNHHAGEKRVFKSTHSPKTFADDPQQLTAIKRHHRKKIEQRPEKVHPLKGFEEHQHVGIFRWRECQNGSGKEKQKKTKQRSVEHDEKLFPEGKVFTVVIGKAAK